MKKAVETMKSFQAKLRFAKQAQHCKLDNYLRVPQEPPINTCILQMISEGGGIWISFLQIQSYSLTEHQTPTDCEYRFLPIGDA